MCNQCTLRGYEHTFAESAWRSPVWYWPRLHTWRHRGAGTAYGPRGRRADTSAVPRRPPHRWAVHLTWAISIIIPCPLMDAVAERGMGGMTAPVALPLIGREPRATRGNVLRDQGRAGVCVGMVADPSALLSGLARDHTDEGRPIVGIGAMPLPLIGVPPGWIGGSSMRGAFVPPRCDTTRRLRRWYPSLQSSVPFH
jgi:hypothetical protein